jgi:hypothetical protein
MINLYESLLGYGFTDFLPPELVEEFRSGLQTLKDDSVEHSRALKHLVEQYNGQ